ncbi:MAG: PEP-CTERM sorting domain-containing protein, partial [Thiobacillus sp.]
MKPSFKRFAPIALFAASSVAASLANATIVTVYDDFDGGLANFDSTVAAAGGTATHDTRSAPVS